jgi:hypothetical protein
MKQFVCGLVALGLFATLGCGGSDFPDPIPVSGTVSYQGKPVEGAKVTFLSRSGGRSASGTTDATGAYALTTFNTDDGAIPDEYTVTIAKYDSADTGESIDAASGEMGANYDEMMAAAASGKGDVDAEASDLPAKYANAAESGLSRTVAEGQANEFSFDLE